MSLHANPHASTFDSVTEVQCAARSMAERCALRRLELGPFPSKEAMERHLERTMTDVAVFLVHLAPSIGSEFMRALTPDTTHRHTQSVQAYRERIGRIDACAALPTLTHKVRADGAFDGARSEA